MKKFLTPKQLAEILQVSPKTVYDWTYTGFVPHVRIGRCVRFDPEKVMRWIASRERKGRMAMKLDVPDF